MAKTRRNRTIQKTAQYGGDFPVHASTFHGMHNWHKKLFEKLGWMVLAKARGHVGKIEEYKNSISRFLENVDHLMAEYEERNRKHDLNVLKINVIELQKFVMKTI